MKIRNVVIFSLLTILSFSLFVETVAGITAILRPNAAGDETSINQQLPDSGFHYDKVDEESADDATTYVRNYNTASYQRDLYNLPASSGSGTINFIVIYFRCSALAGGADSLSNLYAKPSLKSGVTVTDGTAINPSAWATFTTFSQQWNTNPTTGIAWTWADIGALQIGVSLQALAGSGSQVMCTQVYVEVDYTLSAPAPVSLLPGETTFEVPNIVIPPSPPSEDYTQTGQTIALYGDLAYLNIKWNAYYSDKVERSIGIDCYLNCPNPDGNIDTNCAAYKNNTNYCSFVGSTGFHFCTIVRPGYLYKQYNNVTCKFYNPARPDIQYLPYPNRTFKPVDFQVFTERITGTVGKSFILPANIRSTGLFVETYTVNVSAANPSQSSLVFIEDVVSVTSRLKYAEIGKVYPKVTFLSTEKVNLKISTKSNTDPTTCSIDSDCSYLGDSECMGGRCWKKNIIETSAQKASLPEFGLLGFLQIVFLAVIVLFMRTW